MMFTRLSELRAQLAAIPSVKVDAETRAAIVNAIDALDDAMVAEARAHEAARMADDFSLLAQIHGSATVNHKVLS